MPSPSDSAGPREELQSSSMPFGMPSFSAANILGNLLFSAIGYVAYSYGKSMGNMRVRIQGGVLLAYSYFVADTLWLYAIGTALTAWIWLTRDNG